VLAGNHRPQAAVGGPALWRRIRAVPFAHTVPEELRDPELPDKLQQAAGHILAWAIRGAADYLAHGMRQPEAVTAATKAYEQDQDTIGRFIEENIQLTPQGREPVKKIRLAYESWCMEIGVESASAKRLTQELSSRFAITSEKGAKGSRYYVGLMLLDTDDDTEDNEQVTESEESWWQR
jgi:putative DNA primase/helicase